MRFRDVTAIGRPIERNIPTNLAIVVLSGLVLIVGAAVRAGAGRTLADGAVWGLAAGAAVLLAWAIARELDPDRDYAAFVAALVVVPVLWLLPKPSFLMVLWVLLVTRLVNRTTGLRATWIDSLVIAALTAWLTWQWSWVFGAVSATTFLLDARLNDPVPRHRWFAGLCLVFTGLAYLSDASLRSVQPTSRELLWGVLASAFVFLSVLFGSSRIDAIADDTGAPLNARRVQVAQRVTLLAGFLVVLRHSDAGVIALGPLWAAVFGVGVYRGLTFWHRQGG